MRGPQAHAWLVPQTLIGTLDTRSRDHFAPASAPAAPRLTRADGIAPARPRRRRRDQPHRPALDGAPLRGLGRQDRARRPGRPRRSPASSARRDRARRDAARHRRPAGAQPAARRTATTPRAVPHREGLRRGPRHRAHRRRRRLRHQAVLPRGGRGAAARAHPPLDASTVSEAATRASSSATSCSTRRATRSPAPAAQIELTATEFELLRFLMRNPRRVLSRRRRSSTASGATTSAASPASSRSTSPTCARRSTPGEEPMIHTVRGVGLRHQADVVSSASHRRAGARLASLRGACPAPPPDRSPSASA